jgi:precorrin-2/cobalt-factor-2 C20-methyltransferase
MDVSLPSTGRLVGVGVGPGDPRLLTLRAVDALRAADRVVAPTTAIDAPGRAEAVVRQVVPEVRVHRVVFAMVADAAGDGAAARARSHRQAAERLLPWLDAGETVAFVTLGDPNVYSTFPSLTAVLAELRPEIPVETVPGICAFQDLAARSGTVLLDGVETLSLVTALDGTDHLAEALRHDDGAIAVYKGGRHLPAVADLLARHGRLDGAVVGELLGLPGERIAPLAAVEGPGSYLATVLVPPCRDRPPAEPDAR